MDRKKPPDKNYFKCIKVPLKSITKHDTVIEAINKTAIKGSKITMYGLQFIKLYFINYYEKNKTLPKMTDDFINTSLKILCKESNAGRPPSKDVQELRNKLKLFYDSDFKMLNIDTNLDYLHMNTILEYITVDIKTMFENNIKQHYVDFVERFVNVLWSKKETLEFIKTQNFISKKDKEEQKRKFCKKLRDLKNDLLNVGNEDYKSNRAYHGWINTMKEIVLPDKDDFEKNSVYYDLQCNPDEYFICMFKMADIIEKRGYNCQNLFPMRTDISPKHIKIDTTSIIHMLISENKCLSKTYFLTEGRLKKYEDKIWNYFFRTELSCFKKKNYTFYHMICSDGVSCSILLIRNDMIGKRIPKGKKVNSEKYIDELEKKDYERLQNKTLVAIDPNKSDLVYAVDGIEKERNQFRYTQDQRRKETKQKKYRDIVLDLKEEKIFCDTYIENAEEKKLYKSVIELETELSKYNKKTLNVEKFKKYLIKKNEINKLLYSFYEKEIFRKLRLNGYLNRLRSEQMMINNFIEKFDKPENTVIAFGDFEQKKQMKYKEPTKGKGMRDILRKAGFEVYLVDEFRTSCRCNVCEGECETFRICKNPRPWQNEKLTTRHGLTRCKTCKVLWNRDENSSCNIYILAKNAIRRKKRPEYLCRQQKEN